MQKQLERDIRGYIKLGTGLTHVIPGEEDGPRPEEPYASVTLIDDPQEGHPLRSSSLLGERISLYRKPRFLVQFYRAEAHEKALDFVHWSETEAGLEAADRAGFRLRYPLDLDSVDVPVGERWERRTALELTVEYLTEQDTQETGYADNVDIAVTTQQGEELEVDRATVNQ